MNRQLWVCLTAGVRFVTLMATVSVTGCGGERTDARKETTIANNGQWIVKAIGDLKSPSPFGFSRNLVQFQAIRNHDVYAHGPLYSSGPHDSGFDDQYPERHWVGVNSLQLSIAPADMDLATYRLRLTNRRNTVLKWLTVSTKRELLLIVEMEPTRTFEYSLYRWGNGPHFFIQGEWITGEVIRNEMRGLDAYASHVSLDLEPSAISLRVTAPGPPS